MRSSSESVLWTTLTDSNEALTLIRLAAVAAGFKMDDQSAAEIRVEVPRSLRRRRRASLLTGSAAPAGRRTEILWRSDDSGTQLHEHLLAIEDKLQEGVIYYHGLTDAAARAGLIFDGRKELRAIVGLLDRNEIVRAVGKGHLKNQPGFVVLTGLRLIFTPERATAMEPIVNAPHESIEALTLGKRGAGETLRITLAGYAIEISGLGHGEGHGIATSYREELNGRARNNPLAHLSTGKDNG
jgi:hypothetical protein